MTGPTEPAPDTPSAILKMRDLRKMIGDMVDAGVKAATEGLQTVTGTEPAPTGTQRPTRRQTAEPQQPRRSIDDEVTSALEKIERDKARQAKENEWDTSIKELKEKVVEKPPMERSRRHRFMGWGDQ